MMEDRLRQAMPPVGEVELRRDLWPAMLQRMERPGSGLGWLDWTVAGLTATWLAAFPQAIAALLYHL